VKGGAVRLLAAGGVLAAVCGVAAGDADASAYSAFYTPGHAVECQLPVNFAEDARHPWKFMCWTPNDGFTVEMSWNGRARRIASPRTQGERDYITDWARRFGVLKFGADWTCCFDRRGFGRAYYTCQSRSNGLTCRNALGHGWWLGRFRGYRIF
jgi:hypothetical protein